MLFLRGHLLFLQGFPEVRFPHRLEPSICERCFSLTRCALWSFEVDLRTSILYTFPQIRVLLLPRQCQGSMKLVRRRSARGWWALSFLSCNVESDTRVSAQSCHRCHPPKSMGHQFLMGTTNLIQKCLSRLKEQCGRSKRLCHRAT